APDPGRARDQLNPVAALRAEVAHRTDRTPPEVTAEASRPLAELATERDRLADHLRATAPPDTRPELRRLAEERDWLVSVPDRLRNPDQVAALAGLDRRRVALTRAAGDRADWLQRHQGQLDRWADLSHAVAWR